eukprot:CAMPEP_0116022352 /NCGR_PEP_ID=MMETSP0321-20121206/10936_1 /TAXON_ID=163516 /ORGANISM="Leptocylindrus danicus var. danicus, Strain B650" /LENGTH=95 /DNA_ID=CAMNT_0003493407 /DNA_START=137 /DNA_END=424 /DNA_ORIENTATION=+
MSSEQPPIKKHSARDSRLSFTNYAEHTLRKELNVIALKKCNDKVDEFGKCSQEQGLMVTIRCRSQMKALNECLAVHNSEEEFDKYKKMKEEELTA